MYFGETDLKKLEKLIQIIYNMLCEVDENNWEMGSIFIL